MSRPTLVELDDGHELLATLPITLAAVSEFLEAQGIGAWRAGA